MKKYKSLSLERARELFDYNQETGFFSWKVSFPAAPVGSIVGYIDTINEGYRRCQVDGSRYLVHRLIWFVFYGEEPPGMIDHINGDRADNRISNLRAVDSCQNNWNSGLRKDNKTGIKGVFWRPPWGAAIRVRGKRIGLGYFETKEEAAAAYNEAAKKFHVEFVPHVKRTSGVADEAGVGSPRPHGDAGCG